ncbi:MAG: chemotaxis protein CheW [Lachnospiraceae bacterium]
MNHQQELLYQQEAYEDNISNRYLTFLTDRQLFGIPIYEVVQIVGLQEITELPDNPDYIKGVISLRGQIIPVIDTRKRFGRPESSYNDRTCIVIIRVQNNDFGLIVDEVDEVTDILLDQIAPPPKISTQKASDYISGIAQLKSDASHKERVALLLNTAKILGEDELAALSETIGQ